MEIKEAINQLENLKIHCKNWAESELADEIWTKDVEALDIAIKALQEKELPGTAIPEELQLINISRKF